MKLNKEPNPTVKDDKSRFPKDIHKDDKHYHRIQSFEDWAFYGVYGPVIPGEVNIIGWQVVCRSGPKKGSTFFDFNHLRAATNYFERESGYINS